VDPEAIPHLCGRFEPVHAEFHAEKLSVKGALPRDLCGAYLRNGPNPRFTPLGSYTYPLEGDAMIHGVWIEDGHARYANRWVRTQGMEAEERAGRAIFGGLLTPAFVDAALLGPDPDPGWPFRLDPFINVVRHAGRLLALEEGTPPYEFSPDLETIGRYDFGGALPAMCAHPKLDPLPGEMVVFCYGMEEPFLTWAVVDRGGSVSRAPTPVEGVERPFMIHDFVITEHHVVFVIGPAVFDPEAATTGESVLQWRPELGTRFGVLPRDGSASARWTATDPFWAWHFANAFEVTPPKVVEDVGVRIVVDFPWWSHVGLVTDHAGPMRGAFMRATLDLSGDVLELTHLDDAKTEFPRIDDRLTGREHRYVTVGANSGRPGLAPGEHDCVTRYDMRAGTSVSFDCRAVVGEVTFAPRRHATDELDGYYMAFVSALGPDRTSRLLVWDAEEFPSEPVAEVLIPRRVPNGLHGNWFSADAAVAP
jgi:carotenoid cleavage dioxygenase